MKLIFLSLTLLLISCSHNQNATSESAAANKQQVAAKPQASQGIQFFKGSFEQALAEARRTNKILMVDVYTEWCGPCKVMDAQVFPQQRVGEFYNKYFISYKLDAEDESVNGSELAQRYHVDSFPTFLFLDGNGNLIKSEVGGMGANEFIVAGLEVSGADLNGFCETFENGDHSLDAFLVCLAIKDIAILKAYEKSEDMENPAVKKATQEYKDFYAAYYNSWSEQQLLSKDGLELIQAYQLASSRGDKHVEFLVNHIDEYAKIADEPEYIFEQMMYLNNQSISQGYSIAREKARQWVEDIKGKLKTVYMSGLDDKNLERAYQYAMHEYLISKHLEQKNWVAFYQTRQDQRQYLEPGRIDRENNYVDELVYRDCDDKKVLRKAIKTSEKLYKQQGNLFAGITYMKILERLGEKQQASKVRADLEAKLEKIPQDNPNKKCLEEEMST